jgi:hypothetical protein
MILCNCSCEPVQLRVRYPRLPDSGGSGHPREICGRLHIGTEYLPTCIDRQDAENSNFIGAVSAR